MAGQSLQSLGQLQIRMRPRKMGIYVAKQSFPDGVIPAHLKAYTEKFGASARSCASEISRDVKGNDRVWALNACIAGKMK
jgi:hypothetical protein